MNENAENLTRGRSVKETPPAARCYFLEAMYSQGLEKKD